jgi:hypothetical protein
VKLWLDDLRNPANHVGEGWTWAMSAEEAIGILQTREVVELSLDYDLEPGAYGCSRCQAGADCDAHVSGLAVVRWLKAHPEHPLMVIHVHSLNPQGRRRLLAELGF